MSITCKNGPVHSHETVDEVRRCWAGENTSSASTTPSAASSTVSYSAKVASGAQVSYIKDLGGDPELALKMTTKQASEYIKSLKQKRATEKRIAATSAPRKVSDAQIRYIESLGGDAVHAYKLTYQEASDYIVKLKAEKEAAREAERAEREPEPSPHDAVAKSPKLDMIKGMLDLLPEGYYGAQKDAGGHVDFIRLSRPTKGQYAGCVKIQTQHAEYWKEAMILWPSGNWSVYKWPIVDAMLLVLSDNRGAARRYAIELQKCCVCGTKLTDDRSRHYLIGPICDKKEAWQWVIEEVDDKNGGLSYEQLVARGMPTRVWQERVT